MPPAATAAGRQSAAIAVVAPGGGYGGNDDNLVDLRVDDHADPVGELRRLYGIHVLLTGTTPEEQKLPLERRAGRRGARPARARGLSRASRARTGCDEALRAFVGTENLEAPLVARGRGSIPWCSRTCARALPAGAG